MRATHFLIAALLPGQVTHADDWPQWRGPMRDGSWHEAGIVEKFPAHGVKIAWRAQAGGGWSSPIIAGGRVFLSDSELAKPKARERVRCFDAASGKVLWTYACDVEYPDWAFAADQNSGPTSTPAVADGKVYALGATGGLLCLAVASGDLLWRRDLAKEYAVESFKVRASPLVDGGNLIVFIGGKPNACLLALDRHTGREVWRALAEEVSNSSPIIVIAGGRRQLIVWTNESISSLDPANGTLLWREALTTSGNDSIATPVCDGARLLVSGMMFRLDHEKPAASVLWPENFTPAKRILSNTSTPLLAGDSVFSATLKGDLVCLDTRTGQERWRSDKVTDHKSGTSIHITPNGDTAFLYTNRGELIRARLTAAGCEEISRTQLIDPLTPFAGRKVTWSPPAYAGRCVFVRNEREIVCASLAAGEK